MFTIKKETITTEWWNGSICWFGNTILDGTNWTFYGLDGSVSRTGFVLSHPFDRCITSQDGQYVFVYQNLSTKGVLLKSGKFLREINRTYYHATTYEYPAAFYTSPAGKTYLIHCPIRYDQLDFEDIESGEIVTNISGRKPMDIFHSRLELSPDSKFLMVKGWVWHPLDVCALYDIEACLADPTLLDDGRFLTVDRFMEQNIGAFINEREVLLGATEPDDELPPHNLATWDFIAGAVKNTVTVSGEFGNIVGVRDGIAWDFYKYPKIIDIQTGVVLDKMEDVAAGEQVSSILHYLKRVPPIVYNRELNKVAVGTSENQIDVFSIIQH
ncbi:hypothetical protein [Dawidia soli]|uniref:Uncharacterized protein n=1 Tax=Dawidia soli TaxID=2782352 RepID=A0AAP2GKV7_9BACT|nr:hypothetical protein [Dawidia soli]MBT1689468.1 hypothetical protein [Dawidia soli]